MKMVIVWDIVASICGILNISSQALHLKDHLTKKLGLFMFFVNIVLFLLYFVLDYLTLY